MIEVITNMIVGMVGMDNGTLVSVITAIGGIIIGFFSKDFWQNRTAVKLKELDLTHDNIIEIVEQNKKLNIQVEDLTKQLNDMSVSLNRIEASFTIVVSMVKEIAINEPIIINALDGLLKELTRKF